MDFKNKKIVNTLINDFNKSSLSFLFERFGVDNRIERIEHTNIGSTIIQYGNYIYSIICFKEITDNVKIMGRGLGHKAKIYFKKEDRWILMFDSNLIYRRQYIDDDNIICTELVFNHFNVDNNFVYTKC